MTSDTFFEDKAVDSSVDPSTVGPPDLRVPGRGRVEVTRGPKGEKNMRETKVKCM